MISKRKEWGAIALMVLFWMSCIAWIAALFVKFQVAICGLVAVAIMLIFDFGCYREYRNVFPGPSYVIGIVVFTMVGLATHLTAIQLVFGAVLLPLLYVIKVRRVLWTPKIDKGEEKHEQNA